MIRIGLKREGKVPPDTRVALSPCQARNFQDNYPDVEFIVEKSSARCFSDNEYQQAGIEIMENLEHCDLILGIKETIIPRLIRDKTYMFFAHVIKKQAYNRELLRAILQRNIRLIDYETLLDEHGVRLIGFGRYAGIVGAHYALLMWGKKTLRYDLRRAVDCFDYVHMLEEYTKLKLDNPKILVTGRGRVSGGIVEVMQKAGIRMVDTKSFLTNDFEEAVYAQVDADEIYKHKNDEPFDFQHFFHHPSEYVSDFEKFIPCTDILINGIFWDPNADQFFSKKRVTSAGFRIKIIADVSCDINGSIPLTHRSTSIDDPFYGIDRKTLRETEAFQKDSIDMMTIGNLPNELPRDASLMFGEVLSEKVLPLYLEDSCHPVIRHATITENGSLTENYVYLQDFVDGKE